MKHSIAAAGAAVVVAAAVTAGLVVATHQIDQDQSRNDANADHSAHQHPAEPQAFPGRSGPIPFAPAAKSATFAPWPAPLPPQPYVREAGLKFGPGEGFAMHFHLHLDVYVNDRLIKIPANIGIDVPSGQVTAVHTHDDSGILHVEAFNTTQRFSLSQFFVEWNVRLTKSAIGAYQASSTNSLRAYVNGRLFVGDPGRIELLPHSEIALVYGAADAVFNPPTTYALPEGW